MNKNSRIVKKIVKSKTFIILVLIAAFVQIEYYPFYPCFKDFCFESYEGKISTENVNLPFEIMKDDPLTSERGVLSLAHPKFKGYSDVLLQKFPIGSRFLDLDSALIKAGASKREIKQNGESYRHYSYRYERSGVTFETVWYVGVATDGNEIIDAVMAKHIYAYI